MAQSSSVRAFFAVGLPDELREVLAGHLAECARLAPGFRWVEAENLHLTLRFLGQVDPHRLGTITARAEGIRRSAFRVALGGRDAFGRGRRTRVIHLGIAEGQAGLAALAADLEVIAVGAGLPAEERRYNAHLTLARARDRGGQALPDGLPPAPALPAFEVRGFQLYRSELRRTGSVYTVIRAFHMLSA